MKSGIRARMSSVPATMLASAVLHALATSAAVDAGEHATRVKRDVATRLFVMAGFGPDCAFKGYPEIAITAAPTKGQVTFKPGETTTIQYSLSGNCVGAAVAGTGIYYTPAPGETGEDSFTVTGRIGTGEPATRTFSVVIEDGTLD